MDIQFDCKHWLRLRFHHFYASLLPWNRVLVIGPLIFGWWEHPKIQTLGL